MIETKIGKKVFKSPFWVGSSDLIDTSEQAEEVLKYGKDMLGTIVWKTTTMEPRKGYKKPRICDFYGGFLVASGMKNIGLQGTIKEIHKFKERNAGQSVILSIASVNFGNPVEEFIEMTKQIKNLPIDGVELNLSCPHQVAGEKYQTELLAQNADLVGKIVKEVKNILKDTDKVVIVKLTGWNSDIAKISKNAESSGAELKQDENGLHIEMNNNNFEHEMDQRREQDKGEGEKEA